MEIEGLPWWSSGWESTCQGRGHRFDPWSRRILNVVEQLGPDSDGPSRLLGEAPRMELKTTLGSFQKISAMERLPPASHQQWHRLKIV